MAASSTTGLEVLLENMPDPDVGRESLWIPFMKDKLHCDEKTLLIGHSTGAVAAMRYAENNKVFGIVLVAPCVTDGGDETERLSGYFSRPWEWEKIISNAELRIAFGSSDDPLLSWSEIEEVMDKLKTDSYKYTDRGHFSGDSTFKEIVDALTVALKK
ncbi:putative hydrolase RBBP9 [Apostichopus japonicus]|uniref:Putative hydrolase RBBP9 n=1 Tax=Stichopus japonicus TaxID=307972 RepID=A0A2G8LE46_STIJA|nr:putative hydrolase RBBP9 [Apostichopus japonicus]